MKTISITVTGIVQGVGFRPFVWQLAKRFALFGTVLNGSDGVLIFVEGDDENVQQFLYVLKNEPPPLAHIASIKIKSELIKNFSEFSILKSTNGGDFSTRISPDISMCDDCKEELFDPNNRRYHYPFINCTNCGPRFSIINGLPYDRSTTSMSSFDMCHACSIEYSDPSNRRYHAQPIACADCGPQVFVVDSKGVSKNDPWQHLWKDAVCSGQIIAVKGIGGFHLACNALDENVCSILRTRKRREAKPFALMTNNYEWIREHCIVSSKEEKLFRSRECPIVIVKIKKEFPGLTHIAPGLDTIGIMHPYSPMHELMLDIIDFPVVMTSANYSNEPMIFTNTEAFAKISNIADIFILHNRDIINRCDDSVCLQTEKHTIIIRPGRGFSPFTVSTKTNKQLLCYGADMKNTFALSHHNRITVSQYIGDLEHPEAQNLLCSSIEQYIDFNKLNPEYIIHDLHPDYFSTILAKEYALKHNLPLLAVQHHHAHCAAVLTEHNLSGKAIGFAFDGTGFGEDNTIWGGEVLLFDEQEFIRKYYFSPIPLPGADKAVTNPERMLIASLYKYNLLEYAEKFNIPDNRLSLVISIIESGINSPMTSSVGRVFDTVSFLLGFCSTQSYDGEAAMMLEAMSSVDEKDSLPFEIKTGQIDLSSMYKSILEQMSEGVSPSLIAGRFHNTMAQIVYDCGELIEEKYGQLPWVFSGGVFQNRLLVKKIMTHKKYSCHRIYFSSLPNDTGISLGQAIVGLARTAKSRPK